MQLKSFISFILFYFLFINNSFSESVSLVCETEDFEGKREIVINKDESKVYIRKFGSETWQQHQDYVEDDQFFVWLSPDTDNNSKDFLILEGLNKKTLIHYQRFYEYDFSKSKEVFSKWMSLNNYSEDYVRDNPHLLINFLINQAKDLEVFTIVKWKCG
jgi:hypothetical protein